MSQRRSARPGWRLPWLALFAGLALAAPGHSTDDQVTVLNCWPPSMEQGGTTLVPMRLVFDWLGATVEWHESTETVEAHRRVGKRGTGLSQAVWLKVGSRDATVDSGHGRRKVRLDRPARASGGSTYVPLRFVGEAWGVEVGWDARERVVELHEVTATSGVICHCHGFLYVPSPAESAFINTYQSAESHGRRVYFYHPKAREKWHYDDISRGLGLGDNTDVVLFSGRAVSTSRHQVDFAVDIEGGGVATVTRRGGRWRAVIRYYDYNGELSPPQ